MEDKAFKMTTLEKYVKNGKKQQYDVNIDYLLERPPHFYI